MLAKKIKYLRKQHELTQVELAQMANVVQSAISDIENGKRKRINYDVLRRITKVFGLTVDQFEQIKIKESSDG